MDGMLKQYINDQYIAVSEVEISSAFRILNVVYQYGVPEVVQLHSGRSIHETLFVS